MGRVQPQIASDLPAHGQPCPCTNMKLQGDWTVWVSSVPTATEAAVAEQTATVVLNQAYTCEVEVS